MITFTIMGLGVWRLKRTEGMGKGIVQAFFKKGVFGTLRI